MKKLKDNSVLLDVIEEFRSLIDAGSAQHGYDKNSKEWHTGWVVAAKRVVAAYDEDRQIHYPTGPRCTACENSVMEPKDNGWYSCPKCGAYRQPSYMELKAPSRCPVCSKPACPGPGKPGACSGTIETEAHPEPIPDQELDSAAKYELECIAESKEGLKFNPRYLLSMIIELKALRKQVNDPEFKAYQLAKKVPFSEDRCDDWADGVEQAARIALAESVQSKPISLEALSECLFKLAEHYPGRKEDTKAADAAVDEITKVCNKLRTVLKKTPTAKSGNATSCRISREELYNWENSLRLLQEYLKRKASR